MNLMRPLRSNFTFIPFAALFLLNSCSSHYNNTALQNQRTHIARESFNNSSSDDLNTLFHSLLRKKRQTNSTLINGKALRVTLNMERDDLGITDAISHLAKTHSRYNTIVFFLDSEPLYRLNMNVSQLNIESFNAPRYFQALFTGVKNKEFISVSPQELSTLYPTTVPIPTLPKPPSLQKSEFESVDAFKERINVTIQQRRKTLQQLQENYEIALQHTQEQILSLNALYTEYSNSCQKKKVDLLNSLNKNRTLLSQLFVLNFINSLTYQNAHYNAQNKQLHLEVINDYKQILYNAYCYTDSENARLIKYARQKTIDVEFSHSNEMLSLEVLYAYNKSCKLIQASEKFIPTDYSVQVQEITIDVERSFEVLPKILSQPSLQLPHFKELWVIEGVDIAKASVPYWFTDATDIETAGYGVGLTRDEALQLAKADLAHAIYSKIKVSSSYQQHYDNDIKTQYFDRNISQSSTTELKEGDYTLYKQEKHDGLWYLIIIKK